MTSVRIALLGGSPTLSRDAHRFWPIVTDDDRRAVMRVLDRGVLSGPASPEAIAFEDEFRELVGARYAILTHSGTSALVLALAAAGVRAGDHVIIPAYSFVATALAVLHAGAIPIFADVDEETGLLDPDATARAITPRTRAIMPVHVHGCPADLSPLKRLAERHHAVLVEDAAQAHGATYEGATVGAIGTAGGFSLQSSKNLAAGEGGIFVTNDGSLAEIADRLRNFGQDAPLHAASDYDSSRPLDGARALQSGRIGGMYRGNEMMAAFGRSQLARLRERTARCQNNADRLTRALAGLPGITPPRVPEGRTSVHHKFRVRFSRERAGLDLSVDVFREALMQALRAEGLDVVRWQTDVLPAHPVFRLREGFGDGWPWSTDRETDFATLYDPARFPHAKALLDTSIVLFSQSCPLIAQTDETVDRYAEAFRRVWEARFDVAAWAAREGLSRPA
jgi:dTDP-4-amino-4,6-dideoxygalactose transaminase